MLQLDAWIRGEEEAMKIATSATDPSASTPPRGVVYFWFALKFSGK